MIRNLNRSDRNSCSGESLIEAIFWDGAQSGTGVPHPYLMKPSGRETNPAVAFASAEGRMNMEAPRLQRSSTSTSPKVRKDGQDARPTSLCALT
jgi:hypothetical protein